MRARILTAVLVGSLALTAVSRPEPWPVALLLAAVAGVACWELLALLRVWGAAVAAFCLGGVAFAAAEGLGSAWQRWGTAPQIGWWLALGIALQLAGVAALCGRGRPQAGNGTPAAILGPLWILSPLAAAFLLQRAGASTATGWHASPLLLLLLPVWAGDTAAMLVGRRWGRRKLAPTVSPGKTWEGASANLLAATGVGILSSLWFGVPLAAGAACGLACGTLGQAGDLFESWLKRRAGVKDSGTLLPGHGGVLDRIDALLFSAWPVVASLWAFGAL